jgi:hypothetical protein
MVLDLLSVYVVSSGALIIIAVLVLLGKGAK